MAKRLGGWVVGWVRLLAGSVAGWLSGWRGCVGAWVRGRMRWVDRPLRVCLGICVQVWVDGWVVIGIRPTLRRKKIRMLSH